MTFNGGTVVSFQFSVLTGSVVWAHPLEQIFSFAFAAGKQDETEVLTTVQFENNRSSIK